MSTIFAFNGLWLKGDMPWQKQLFSSSSLKPFTKGVLTTCVVLYYHHALFALIMSFAGFKPQTLSLWFESDPDFKHIDSLFIFRVFLQFIVQLLCNQLMMEFIHVMSVEAKRLTLQIIQARPSVMGMISSKQTSEREIKLRLSRGCNQSPNEMYHAPDTPVQYSYTIVE